MFHLFMYCKQRSPSCAEAQAEKDLCTGCMGCSTDSEDSEVPRRPPEAVETLRRAVSLPLGGAALVHEALGSVGKRSLAVCLAAAHPGSLRPTRAQRGSQRTPNTTTFVSLVTAKPPHEATSPSTLQGILSHGSARE